MNATVSPFAPSEPIAPFPGGGPDGKDWLLMVKE